MAENTTKARIVICEDEAIIAADLETRLTSLGYDICGIAATGETALALVEQHQPDLVMMDIVIQGEMDGLAAAEVIRDKWGIPVVFVTDYADSDRLKRADLAYPFGYLLRPVKDNELKITTEMALYVANTDAERRRVEQALAASEEQYRLLVESTGDIVLIHDENGVITFSNNRGMEFSGYSLEEFRGRNVMEFMPQDELEALIERRDNRYAGDDLHYQFETAFINRHGERIEVDVNSTPIFRDGLYLGQMIVARDITARKQAERSLKRSQKRFSELAELLPETIFELDENARLTFVNRNAFKQFRYTQHDFDSGLDALNMIVPEDRPRTMENMIKILQGEDIGLSEYQALRKDGTTFPALFHSAAIYDEGKPAGLRGFIIDISERKHLEAQLQQAQKMEAIGTLASGIAHDFNNLLQAINGYTQLLLLDKEEDDPEYRSLAAIQKSGNRAAELVRGLLLFSRKAEIERKPLELNVEVEHARKVLERTIPKMVDIEIHLGSRIWLIMADPVQIEQIILNLGKNAADAMPEGGRLVIETANIVVDEAYAKQYPDAQTGRYALLTISDTGHGMDHETQKKIFDPFFTTKEIGQGTGLGLASVYGIVKSHGGAIGCYSEIEQGTSFKIYFPAMEEPATEREKNIATVPPKGGNEVILLVDDEETIRGFAEQALVRFGYQVFTASNGEEALKVYQSNPGRIDLVVMDIGMPGMGGHRCLRELLQINPEVKVLIASGYSIHGQVEKSIEAGAVGYVGKPYQLSDLLGSVRSALD